MVSQIKVLPPIPAVIRNAVLFDLNTSASFTPCIFRLPPEILTVIAELLQPLDIVNFVRVCQLFKDVAERLLYRSICISGIDSSLSCFTTISTRPAAAQAVRSLSWRLSPYIDIQGDINRVPECIAAFHVALPMMVNLHKLRLPVNQVITEDLRERLTNDFLDQGLCPASPHSIYPNTPSLLPSLRHIETNCISSLAALSSRRPITHIRILSLMSFTTLDQILPRLSRSTGPLRKLTVPLQSSLVEAVHAIVIHLPFLSSLEVGVAETVGLDESYAIIERICEDISSLKSLTRFYIPILINDPLNFDLHFSVIRRLHKACPSLVDTCVSVVPWKVFGGTWSPSPMWRSTHVWWEKQFQGRTQKEARKRWGPKVPMIKARPFHPNLNSS